MRRSKFFLPMLRETPKEADTAAHQLMLRAGMIRQSTKGIYVWLPLGFRVLQRIATIVRDEMTKAGAVELLMPTIQPADLWRESGRYDDFGPELLRFKDRGDRELLYGPTNEEQITQVFAHGTRSYRDLPLNLFHIQWKFRDEVRPRFGVMRGREFLMKDAYSFDIDAASARITYDLMYETYVKTFRRMGLMPIPALAASGPIGGDISHEFHVLAATGESRIIYDPRLETSDLVAKSMREMFSITDEMSVPGVVLDSMKTATSIEVGHIFLLGDKYTRAMNVRLTNSSGDLVYPQMGCYGIGISRLVGAIIEANHDEHGIVWPNPVAPFEVGIVMLGTDPDVQRLANVLYDRVTRFGLTVLIDDRDERAGVKFAEMDLIGIPRQIIIGTKSLDRGYFEIKKRASDQRVEHPIHDIDLMVNRLLSL